MSAIHEFKCDSCKLKVPAKYNGEHYLPPHNWVELFDTNRSIATGEHLCNNCLPKTPQNKGKRNDKKA